MLTLKLITEETERVIAGLEKKNFKGAREAIDNVMAVDKKRREAQQKMDSLLAEQKKAAGNIGRLMKEGKKDEAEEAKKTVAALKDESLSLRHAALNSVQRFATLGEMHETIARGALKPLEMDYLV